MSRDPSSSILIDPRSDQKVERPRMWRVLLHNDDYTTQEFVVWVLEFVFRKPRAEAVDVINREAPFGARVYKRCVEPSHLAWLRGDLWPLEVSDPARADWFLVYQPSWKKCPIPADAKLVHEVSAQGAPLARVYRRAPVAFHD